MFNFCNKEQKQQKTVAKNAILSSICALTLAFSAIPAVAATDFPDGRPIRLVVGYAAGTAPDILARRISERLNEQFKVSTHVENYPGAGGRLAADKLARAPADGHTLAVTVFGPYSLLPFFEDVAKSNDFTPISMLGRFDAILAVSSESKWKDAVEMTNSLKTGHHVIATPPAATVVNLAAHQFRLNQSLDAEIVPYPKSSVAMIDLTTGRLDLAFTTVSVATPFVQKGTARIIAVTGPDRSPAFPDAPTLTEIGLADTPTASWYGLFAPPSTSPEIVQQIYEAISPLRDDVSMAQTLSHQGVQPVFSKPSILAQQWGNDNKMWSSVIEAMNSPKNISK